MSMNDDVPRRLRSPPYPFIPLGKAVERARQLYPKALHHSVGISILGEAWFYGSKSSGLVQTAAALIQFGLMVDEGAGDKRKFQLTREAIRIIQDSDPDSAKRKELLKRAALTPKLHQELWARFTTATMSDSVVRNYLMFDRVDANEAPFSPESANSLISEYKATLSYANIDSEGIPPGLMGGEEEEHRINSVEDRPGQAHNAASEPVRTARHALKVGMKEDVFSLPEGDVVLQWPEQISAESYQDLAAWAQIILRKIKRAVPSGTGSADEGGEQK
jgi:hypothetical protein